MDRRKNKPLDLKKHLVDTTAVISFTYPPLAIAEVRRLGASVSIWSRLKGAGFAYLGMGSVFSRGRDLSRMLFRVPKSGREGLQIFHDSIYSGAFAAAYIPLVNMSSGATAAEAFGNSPSYAFVGAVTGPLTGGVIDVGRDLMGISECKRGWYPKAIKNRSPRVKKLIAAGLVAASLMSMAKIYSPDDKCTLGYSPETEQLEQKLVR
ncbi:hypothetical protein CMI41_00545 [Candidatus Pacearchaeota archaeon]|nr:hypothetical protein [Candidatus Pacearchaeota archaeon]